MAIHIDSYTADTLPSYVAEDMARLTNVGSQHAKWLLAASAGKRAENTPEDIVWAVASREQDYEIKTLGWCSVHCDEANGHPLLAGFVAQQERRKHLATILSAVALMAAGVSKDAIGVRSREFLRIVDHLGFKAIGLYAAVDDGWIVSWSRVRRHEQQQEDD